MFHSGFGVKKFRGSKCLILGSNSIFDWDAASQSTKCPDMLKTLGVWPPGPQWMGLWWRKIRHIIECDLWGLTPIYANSMMFVVIGVLQREFSQMFFILGHIDPKNFRQIEHERFEDSQFFLPITLLAQEKCQSLRKIWSYWRIFVIPHLSRCGERWERSFLSKV